MVKAVIGFFPGAGGNRYMRYLQNQEYQTLNRSYDDFFPEQYVGHRYLLDSHYDRLQNAIVLTHCMNQKHIRGVLNSDVHVTVLHFPMQSCIRREWMLRGNARYIVQNRITADNLDKKIECYNAFKTDQWPDVKNINDYESLPKYIKQEVDDNFVEVISSQNNLIEHESAAENIQWHRDYYQKYPVDTLDCTVLHINDDNVFCRIMRDELALYQSHVFDRAWETIMNE